MARKTFIADLTELLQSIEYRRAWKELRKNRNLIFIDLALLGTSLLLIIANEKAIFLHFVFIILIYGAFFWSVLAFVYRVGFWVMVTATIMTLSLIYGKASVEDLFELLILTLILLMIFGISRKRSLAEKALRESENRYRRLVELAFEYVIIIVDETIVFVNPQAVKFFNANNLEELIGESISKLLHPVSFEGFKILVKRVMEGDGEMPLIEEQFVRLDSTYIDVEAVGLVVNYEGELALQLVIRDITERKRAAEALRISNIKFRGLLESAPDAVVVTDKNGVITLVNAQTEKMFGYEREELVGNYIEVLLPNRMREEHVQHRKNYRSQPVLREMGPDLKIFGQRKNGRKFPTNVKLSPQITEEGLTITAIIRDITDREKAEKQVVRAARLAALGQMATALAHELNNPLQIIVGYLDVILDFPLELEDKGNYLQIIRQQIERLQNATWRILNYARPKQESQQIVTISELIEQVLVLTSKQLHQKGIRVETDFQNVPAISVVPDQLVQVLLNLVINAIESAEEDGLVHIWVNMIEGHVAISFVTYGTEIPSKDLPHIFEPFYTTKIEGSGLGLWVSRNLVEQNGGTLEAENLDSVPGVVFTAKFPPADIGK